jgi:molybdopterin-guanine dinucleotide biosynthesis protein
VNKLTNREGFKEEIANTIQLSGHPKTIGQVDDEAENLMKIIQKAAWKNTPMLKI